MTDTNPIAGAQAALASRPIEAPLASNSHAEMREAAKQFETVFINEMLGFMYQGVPTNGPFSGGNGEAVMRSMLHEEYAKSIAARGGVGISDTVYRELLAIQEGTTNASAKSE